jgi:hypothetical protein
VLGKEVQEPDVEERALSGRSEKAPEGGMKDLSNTRAWASQGVTHSRC